MIASETVMQFHLSRRKAPLRYRYGLPDADDVSEEYRQLELAGLSFRDVLSMLTTNPAGEVQCLLSRWIGETRRRRRRTVLSADPAVGDLRNFAHVLYAIPAPED